MADRRRIATTSARIVVGVVGVVIAALTLAAAGQVTVPVLSAPVPQTAVSPVSSGQTRVCAGPLLALGTDGSLSAFASPDFVTASADEPKLTGVASPDNASVESFGSPVVAHVDAGDDDGRPLLAATQSQMVNMSDLAGFTATACGDALAESWLVGGSSDVGRTGVISLTNPTESDATVDLEFFGENGPVDAPGAGGIIVRAGEQRLFSLAGFAPDVLTSVVKVTASGGQVYATLQQSSVRGVTPAGVETVSSSQGPATTQRIAGVIVPSDAPPATDGEGYDDNVPAVRVFVPGDRDQQANIEVSFTDESGGEAPLPITATIYGGVVGEIPLAGVAGGSYGITVSSDVPVVASARTVTATGGTDFAWFTASAPLDDDVAVAVAPGPRPSLHVFNPSDTAIEGELTPDGGSATAVNVPARSAIEVPLTASGGYTLTGASGTFAQVVYRADGAFSAFAVQPAGAEAAPVTVYPRG